MHYVKENPLFMKLYICGALLFWLLGLFGCGKEEPTGTPVVMSFVNYDGSKMTEQKVYLQGTTTEEQLKEVLDMLSTPPQKLEYQVPLSQGIRLLDYRLVGGERLVLDVSAEYKQLQPQQEILTRASLVKSVCQVTGIKEVMLQVEGADYLDSLGKTVGIMTGDMFIDNAGKEISTYDKITVRLYFTNETGDRLVAVDRSKAYNTNISLDKFVMEELLKGPESTTQNVYPTINPDTKLISTFVKDNICYVNLDGTFLKQVYEVDAEIVIYSIVNSLCELSHIDRVQIYVDGKAELSFRERIPLSTVFERDLSYIKK